MQLDVQLDQSLVADRDLKRVPVINFLLDSTPGEIETEIRNRVTSQAEAVDMLVHMAKLLALLLRAERDSRRGG